MTRDYIELLRPWQWTKNFFIFLPLFFALKILDFDLLTRAIFAFLFFNFLSSAVYIFNDCQDKEDDKKHPRKKDRPIADGRVSPNRGLTLAGILLVIGLLGLWYLGTNVFVLALIYLLINVLYTIKLKHMAIVDVMVIAAGFVIRIYVGGCATDVAIYPWIVIMTFLLALFLALGKRRDDLIIFLNSGEKMRKSIEGYSLSFIDGAMLVMASVTIVSYLMYTVSPDITAKFHTNRLYLTSFFVLLGLLRYLQITMVEQKSIDPTEVILKDALVQLSIAGWVITFGILIYLQ